MVLKCYFSVMAGNPNLDISGLDLWTRRYVLVVIHGMMEIKRATLFNSCFVKQTSYFFAD